MLQSNKVPTHPKRSIFSLEVILLCNLKGYIQILQIRDKGFFLSFFNKELKMQRYWAFKLLILNKQNRQKTQLISQRHSQYYRKINQLIKNKNLLIP